MFLFVKPDFDLVNSIVLFDSLPDHLYAHSFEQESLPQDQMHITSPSQV